MNRRLLLVTVTAVALVVVGGGVAFALTRHQPSGTPQAACTFYGSGGCVATPQPRDTSGDLACGLLRDVLDQAGGDAQAIIASGHVDNVTQAAAQSTHPAVKAAGAALRDAYAKAQAKPGAYAETTAVFTAATRMATECVKADLR